MTDNLINSLALVLKTEPNNAPLLRNYLARLGVEVDSRLAPPESRSAEACYLAAVLLHDRGIVPADVVEQYRGPWEKWHAEMERRRGLCQALAERDREERDRVEALPPIDRVKYLEGQIEALKQKNLLKESK